MTIKIKKFAVYSAAILSIFKYGAGPLAAQEPIDDGKYIAVRYCNDCHEIGPDHVSFRLVKEAPSFIKIANDPEKGTEKHLKHVLGLGSHSLMITQAGGYLTPTQVHSVIQYIQKLKN